MTKQAVEYVTVDHNGNPTWELSLPGGYRMFVEQDQKGFYADVRINCTELLKVTDVSLEKCKRKILSTMTEHLTQCLAAIKEYRS